MNHVYLSTVDQATGSEYNARTSLYCAGCHLFYSIGSVYQEAITSIATFVNGPCMNLKKMLTHDLVWNLVRI